MHPQYIPDCSSDEFSSMEDRARKARLFLESFSMCISTQFSYQMAPDPIVATELSDPALEYIDTGGGHSDVLTKTPL